MSENHKIVVLISGRGSNFKAIYETAVKENWKDRYGIEFAAVISNRPDAAGLGFAKENNIPTHVVDHKEYKTREDFEKD